MKLKSLYTLLLSAFVWASWSCTDEKQVVAIETGTVTDAEGNVYKTVKVGDQWWMAENLKSRRFSNGDNISFVNTSDVSGWSSLNGQPACAVYQDRSDAPGILYNHAVIEDARGIAPAGWHVATDQDWKRLEQQVGMTAAQSEKTGWRGGDIGDKLKRSGTESWNRYDGVWASNAYGFSATAGGCRIMDGRFSTPTGLVYSGFWWTATPQLNGESWYRYLDYKSSGIFRSHTPNAYGMSIRCVKN